jgi:hypothetical protein
MSIVDAVFDVISSIKLVLAVLLTQMGKTFMAINRIKTELDRDGEDGKSIHLVFTMNTLLNNKQFAKRLCEIEAEYGEGSIVIFASKYKGPYNHAKTLKDLKAYCLDERTCPRIVIMCSNDRRYEDGEAFLDVLERNNTSIVRAYVYYDELHAYIRDSLRKQIETIHGFTIVKGIIALTATPYKIWQQKGTRFWSQLRIIDLDEFNTEHYAGYSDMIFNEIDCPYKKTRSYDELDGQVIGYIKHILSTNDILKDGARIFMPAHVRRSGHYRVRTMVMEMCPHAVVIVLNGEEKSLQYKSEGLVKTVPLESDDEEVCETIARKIREKGLEGRPLVYTGYLCITMGQTLTHSSMGSFTAAILSHLDLTNDEIYQLFGRVTGRMKAWPTYCQTEIYCPTVIMHRIRIMEECAKTLAMDYNGEITTQEEYCEPMMADNDAASAARANIRVVKEKKEPRSRVARINPNSFRIFDDFETVKKYCAVVDYRVIKWKEEDMKDGFVKVGLNKEKAIATLKQAIKKVAHGYGGKPSQFRTYYTCYRDLTDVNSRLFVVLLRVANTMEDTDEVRKIREADAKYPAIPFEDAMME